MSTPEGEVKKAIIDYLQTLGVLYFRTNSGTVKVRGAWMRLCRKGTADILAFRREHPIWLEIKGPGQVTAKAQKDAQAEFRDEVEFLGHTYRIVSSVEEVAALIGGRA